MHNVTAVVPVADLRGETSKAHLERLLQSPCFPGLECLVCFDACSEDFVEYFQEKYPFIQVSINRGNRLNFARNSNRGLREVYKQGKDAILINQDCKLPDLDSMLKMSITTAEGKAIVSARAVNTLELPETTTGLDEVQRVPFYCTYIPHVVMDKLGFLDGVFSKGSFEDDDYCTRALLRGLKVYLSYVFVYHEGSFIDCSKPDWTSPSGAYDQFVLGTNKDKYFSKYQIPGDVPHDQAINWVLSKHTWTDTMRIN